jgi:hypothetical protein
MPILQLENSRFFCGISSFFLLFYTREILRFPLLTFYTDSPTYIVAVNWLLLFIVINFSYINNSFTLTTDYHKSNSN